MKKFIKRNIKLLILLTILIALGVVSTTLALRNNGININTASVKVNVRYELDSNNEYITSINSNGDIVPITLDTSDINNVLNSNNVLKYKFWVSGDIFNPNNSIYDIALNNINIDCELKDTYVKWLLYKNNNLLSSGNFSPLFDIMEDNRMVLTNTEEDLTNEEDEYLFVIYIEEACPNFNTCKNKVNQSNLLGRSISANISIEASSGNKKENTRTTGEVKECTGNNTSTIKPECISNLVYTGEKLNLIKNIPSGVKVNQNTGLSAGDYTITAKLNKGYIWNDNTTEDYVFTCKINKKSITINTLDQNKDLFTSDVSNVKVTNLVEGHYIKSISLSTIGATGGDVIAAGRAVIYDSNNNDVTNNYIINYQSTGKIIG